MKVYVVLSGDGTVLAVYRSKVRAEKAVENLNTIYYDKATIKECMVL